MSTPVLSPQAQENLARAIHADYLRRRRAAGPLDAGDPSVSEWDSLPDTLKHANRDQARDIAHKLSLLGYGVVSAGEPGARPLSFSSEELEMLSVIEHERWAKERIGQGWHYGPKRDLAAKTHPGLVAWDQLSESAKDLDRDAVRLIPHLLELMGLQVADHPKS